MELFAGAVIAGIVLAVVVGLFIGVLSGMLGVGGGTIMVPVFSLGFGMTAIQATASSLFSIVFVSISGCATHIRNKTCIIPVGICAGLAGAVASPAGVYLASVSPSWAIMVAAALVIGYSGYTMFKKAMALPSKRQREAQRIASEMQARSEAASEGDGKQASPKADVSVKVLQDTPESYRKERLWMSVPIGLVAGLCSGYVGVGGGFLMVPLFLSLLSVPMRQASGTSLLAILILAIPGAATQLALGNVNLLVCIATIAGAIPGAVTGANLARRIPERELRFLFAGMLVVSAILLVVKEVAFPVV